jgi:hypothetical protein
MAGQPVCLLVFFMPSARLELQTLAIYNMVSVILDAYWYIQRLPYKSKTLGGKNMLQQDSITNREHFMTPYIITVAASNFPLTPHYVCLSTV